MRRSPGVRGSAGGNVGGAAALEDLPQAQPPLTSSPAAYAEAMRKAG
jgi:hypothetical protein